MKSCSVKNKNCPLKCRYIFRFFICASLIFPIVILKRFFSHDAFLILFLFLPQGIANAWRWFFPWAKKEWMLIREGFYFILVSSVTFSVCQHFLWQLKNKKKNYFSTEAENLCLFLSDFLITNNFTCKWSIFLNLEYVESTFSTIPCQWSYYDQGQIVCYIYRDCTLDKLQKSHPYLQISVQLRTILFNPISRRHSNTSQVVA